MQMNTFDLEKLETSQSTIRINDTLHRPHLLGQYNFMKRLHWNIALEMLVGILHEIPTSVLKVLFSNCQAGYYHY